MISGACSGAEKLCKNDECFDYLGAGGIICTIDPAVQRIQNWPRGRDVCWNMSSVDLRAEPDDESIASTRTMNGMLL